MRTKAYTKVREDGTLEVSGTPVEGFDLVWADWNMPSYRVMMEIEESAKEPCPSGYYINFLTQEDMLWRRLLKAASWFEVVMAGEEVDTKLLNENVQTLDPRVSRALLEPLTDNLYVGKREQQQLYVQATQLFTSKGGGVKNPMHAVRMYVDMATFWDKFGLSYLDLEHIPFNLAQRLKKLSGMESERRDFEHRAEESRMKARERVMSAKRGR